MWEWHPAAPLLSYWSPICVQRISGGTLLLNPCTPELLGNFAPVSISCGLGAIDQGHHFGRGAAHFEDALAFCRKAAYRPELAWTCSDYADALRERSGDGDRAKAMCLLDESLTISTELGMQPLMERVQSRPQAYVRDGK